jgi:hypothetical protein
MICTAIFWNGAMTGKVNTKVVHRKIPPVEEVEATVYYGAGAGSTVPHTVGRHFVSATDPTVPVTFRVFVSFSE